MSQELIQKLEELKALRQASITEHTQALEEVKNSIVQKGDEVKNQIAQQAQLRAGVRLLKNVNPYKAYMYQEVLRNSRDEIVEYGDVIIAGGESAENTGGDNAGHHESITVYHRVHLPQEVFLLDVIGGEHCFYGIEGEKSGATFKNTRYLWVWGRNYQGSLGVGHTSPVRTPVRVEFSDRIKKVVASNLGDVAVAFVLLENGALLGAGRNAHGQMGIGNTADCNRFVRITLPSRVKNVWCSRDSDLKAPSVFAQLDDNRLYAWGYNGYGQLGVGSTESVRSVPTLIPNLPQREIKNIISIVDDAKAHTLIHHSDGYVYGAGNADETQLNGRPSSNVFTKLTNTRIYNDCILFGSNRHNIQGFASPSGNITCWGYGEYGFGDSIAGNRRSEVQVRPFNNASSLFDLICEPYRYAGYALLANPYSKSEIWVFGHNGSGKLATGTGDSGTGDNRTWRKIKSPKNIKEIHFSGGKGDSNSVLLASDGYRIYASGYAHHNVINFTTNILTPQNIPTPSYK